MNALKPYPLKTLAVALACAVLAGCAGTSQPEQAQVTPAASAGTEAAREKGEATQPQAWPADVHEFARAVAQREHLDPQWVKTALSEIEMSPRIQRLMIPHAARGYGNWTAYRKRFIDPIRIREGVQFWERNRDALARAERDYGVPPQIIVAIIGVETVYGRNMGGFRVIDALGTLAFNFPQGYPQTAAREAYFRNELAQFLVLCAQEKMDPAEVTGSYAGAMGMPQFMPSSWLKYAVDYEGDKHIDLWESEADAIGSVANYFKGHGWQRGVPSYFPVTVTPGADVEALLEPDITPTFDVRQFQALGARLGPQAQDFAGKLALIRLVNGNPKVRTPDYVAGTQNFYAVTRYNHSSFYAMSVIELGERIAQAMGE